MDTSHRVDDILEPRRSTSDFFWSVYDGGASTPAAGNDGDAAKNAVLGSTRLREMIETLAREACNNSNEQNTSSSQYDDGGSGVPQASYQEKIAELYTDAVGILNEMGHQFSSSTIRLMGFMLSKVFKRLYTHIWVDSSGIEELRHRMAHMQHSVGSSGSRSGKCPVILVPTHRSYVDFLVLSFVLFTYNLQVPLIVAGIDFLKMSFVAQMLRQSGAFFIRRSFSDDRLYWTLFADYVQELLRIDSHPLEFFIEGTRSRSGKPLYPRIGMLNVVAEMWSKGRIYDACFVPVTIDYDRPLEESLHIREVLGHAKPQETTTGLVKAMSILRENFGSVRVSFHRPLMLRDSIDGAIDRSQLNLMPLFSSVGAVSPQSELGEALNRFGLEIVLAQTRQMRVTPFHLLCALILQQLPYSSGSSSSHVANGSTTSSPSNTAASRKSFSFTWLSHRVLCAWRLMEQLDKSLTLSFIAERGDADEKNFSSAGDSAPLHQQATNDASTVAILEDELRRACHIHHNLLSLDSGFITLSLSSMSRTSAAQNGDQSSMSEMSSCRPSSASKTLSPDDQDNNVYMLLAFYRNHLLALKPITNAALLSVCAGDVQRYELLCDMFSREFVCIAARQSPQSPIASVKDVTPPNSDPEINGFFGYKSVVHEVPADNGMLIGCDLKTLSADDSSFLVNLVMPFLKAYYIVLLALLQFSSSKRDLPTPIASLNGIINGTNITANGSVTPSEAPSRELRCTSLKAFTKHLQNLVRQIIFDKKVSDEREMLSLDTIANTINWLKYRRLLTVHHRVDADQSLYIAVVCSNLKELEYYTQSLRSILLSSSLASRTTSTLEQVPPVRNGKIPNGLPQSVLHALGAAGVVGDEFVSKLDIINLGSILENLTARHNKDSALLLPTEGSSVLIHGKL